MIISIINQKGGVGKTTTAVNLGAALSRAVPVPTRGAHRAVLLVDLDVTQRDLQTYAANTSLNVAVCDAGNLKRTVEAEVAIGTWDHIIIDCPPRTGEETSAALALSDVAVIPVQPEPAASTGLSRILKVVEEAQSAGNNRVYSKALITMLDARDEAAQVIAADLRRKFGTTFFEAQIKRSPLFTQAALEKQSILQYSPLSHGAKAYACVATELLRDNFL
jgi:chromosome partitioning protein